MTDRTKAALSQLPSISALLDAAAEHKLIRDVPHGVLSDLLREAVDAVRQGLLTGTIDDAESRPDALLDRAAALLKARQASRIRRVINATGIVLHTGLGRSALAQAAVDRITQAAAGYCNLEIDLESGERGRRGDFAGSLLCSLTGAEAALIVNNNAAATMLALRALAGGKEVIVSRGQLIEIGGSYRLPEVMSAGGAILREVGTTNKTRVADYAAAINERTGLILHVHTSNFRVVGFAETPTAAELIELAHRHGLPMMDDLGSGALVDHPLWAATDEPTAAASLRAGADVVCFSGDKLLGGPQAGILLGKKPIIERLRKDPMARALRVDKLTLAALEATLELYQSPETVMQTVPTLRMLSEDQSPDRKGGVGSHTGEPSVMDPDRSLTVAALTTASNSQPSGLPSLTARAESLRDQLAAALPNERFEVRRDEAFAGGGSLPDRPLPTMVVAWQVGPGGRATRLAHALRTGDPAVLTRVQEDCVLFDVRTVQIMEPSEISSAACRCTIVS